MKKYLTFFCLCAAFLGFVSLVWLLTGGPSLKAETPRASGQWRYKMTVIIETPEGLVTGSAVREMGNATPRIQMPDVGNPADVRGEAVVVDIGARGLLFALISHSSDLEFYNAYREIWPRGGSTPEAIQFYSNMPIGTKGVLNPNRSPGYPKLVTFTDMNDPKSVTLAQIWERGKDGLYSLKQDHMEELFGAGVKLKSIELEITDEPTTWGVVDQYLTKGYKNLNLGRDSFRRDLSKGIVK